METLAGCLLGYGDDQILIIDHEDKVTKVVTITGTNLYVKKCNMSENIGDIFIPEKSQNITTTCIVLAMSKGCNKINNLPKDKLRRQDCRNHVEIKVKPLDKIILPDDHSWAIMRSSYGKDEFFIDRCIVMAIIPDIC